MANVHCLNCKFSLTLVTGSAGNSLNCPKCNELIRIPSDSVPPTPISLPDDSPEDNANYNVKDARGVSFKDRLIRIAIPLGYILFVVVPLVFTIRFFVQISQEAGQQETSKVAPEGEAKKTPSIPPIPKSKREGKSAPVGVVIPPKTDLPNILPAPRDLGAELEALVVAARDPDPAVRSQSARALGVFLGKKDTLIRRKAAETLAEMGADAEPSLAALRDAVQDPDDEVQKFAKQSLDKWMVAGRKAQQLEALVKDLKAKEPEARVKALHKIAAFGADGIIVSDSVIEMMRDKEKAVQDAAVETLNKVNPNAEIITLCAIGLQARDAKSRIKTLEQIEALGPKGKIVSELVIGAMFDKGEGVQVAAFKTLGQVNPALHAHVVALFHGSPDERRKALTSLGELASEAACTIPLLLVCNDKPKLWGNEPHFDLFPTIVKIAPRNKRLAAAVLGVIAAPNPGGETALTTRRLAGITQLDVIEASIEEKIAALQVATSDNHTLPQVFKAWEKVAPKDKRYTAAVLGCITAPKPNPDRLSAGIASLDVIDATIEEQVVALHVAISNGSAGSVVFEALRKIAPKDKRFAAAVLATVAVPNPNYESVLRVKRLAGIAQFDVIDATLEEKVGALVLAMSDNGTVSQVFAELGKLAPKDKRFIAAVLNSVEAPNPDSTLAIRERRLAGIAQLNVIDATTQQKVKVLETAMKDKGTLPTVLKTLAEYGAHAKSALPAIKELKSSMNEAVRSAAITAIVKIETALAEK